MHMRETWNTELDITPTSAVKELCFDCYEKQSQNTLRVNRQWSFVTLQIQYVNMRSIDFINRLVADALIFNMKNQLDKKMPRK